MKKLSDENWSIRFRDRALRLPVSSIIIWALVVALVEIRIEISPVTVFALLKNPDDCGRTDGVENPSLYSLSAPDWEKCRSTMATAQIGVLCAERAQKLSWSDATNGASSLLTAQKCSMRSRSSLAPGAPSALRNRHSYSDRVLVLGVCQGDHVLDDISALRPHFLFDGFATGLMAVFTSRLPNSSLTPRRPTYRVGYI